MNGSVVGAGLLMKKAPDGYRPRGWGPSASQAQTRSARDLTPHDALRSWRWYALWVILFLNTTAGISIITQTSPMAQEMTHATAVAAAGMVGMALAFLLLSRVQSLGGLAVLAFVVLLCYGGGFGTMPAFAADLFGPGNVGSIYGLMLALGRNA